MRLTEGPWQCQMHLCHGFHHGVPSRRFGHEVRWFARRVRNVVLGSAERTGRTPAALVRFPDGGFDSFRAHQPHFVRLVSHRQSSGTPRLAFGSPRAGSIPLCHFATVRRGRAPALRAGAGAPSVRRTTSWSLLARVVVSARDDQLSPALHPVPPLFPRKRHGRQGGPVVARLRQPECAVDCQPAGTPSECIDALQTAE